ncbi:MAG: phage tail tube protein [Chloroflexi bacterium]|nr:phage tail tube protein [Chloroflexota bacterium]
MPALTSYLASQGFIGVAAETTIGTPVAAVSYVQLLDESIVREPGIVLEKLMRGSRDTAFVPVLGEQKITGKIDTPLYVDQGMHFLTAAIGADLYQYASTAVSTVAIGGTGLVSGITSLTLAALPVSLVANDYLQLNQGTSSVSSASNLSELRKVVSITGTGPYTVVVDSATRLAYTATGVVARVPGSTTVFTHVLVPDKPNASSYKTLTVEKCLGGLTSLQYAGTLVSKMALAMTTKSAVKATYDLTALGEGQITPSTPSFGTSAPLALANQSVNLWGAGDTSVASFDLDLDNTGKEFWTFNGGNLPSIAAPVERKITGKFTSILQSMGYYNDMTAGTTGSIALDLVQGASNVYISLPQCVLTKLSAPLKVGDLVMYDGEFQATYADSSGTSISVSVNNGKYLPFI